MTDSLQVGTIGGARRHARTHTHTYTHTHTHTVPTRIDESTPSSELKEVFEIAVACSLYPHDLMVEQAIVHPLCCPQTRTHV